MLHKKPTVYLALGGIGATLALVGHLNGQSPVQPPPIEPAVNPYDVSVAASGIVEALHDNVAIGVPEPGLVEEVHVQAAESVQAGQALFTLDGRELRAQLAVDRASAGVAEATLHRLQDQLARLQGVADARAVSREELRTKANDVAVARAELEEARARLRQNEVRLERLTIAAPRAGTILQVNVRAGEYASVAPKSPAVILGDVERLQVRADVDEQDAPRLEPGQTAMAYVKGDTARPIELSFVRVEPFVVPKVSLTGASTERVDTRVLQVIYSFERPADRMLYVGQQVDVFVRSRMSHVSAEPKRIEQFAKN